jgi:shikimate dehydrogenase
MSEATKFAGILGWPVQQSLSPVLHGFWLKEHGLHGAYVPLPVRPEDFAEVVAALPRMGFAGVNVTIPHKEAAFALAAELDDDARDTGAANVLVFEGGRVRGMNTDAHGFQANIEEAQGGSAAGRGPALVLGAGGAARAVLLALARAGAPEIRLVNRTRARADALAAEFRGKAPVTVMEWGDWRRGLAGAALLVNTTSLGMTGKPALDLPLDGLPPAAVVVDIVYNPLDTDLLRRARAAGHPTVDGLGMLMHQAVPAFAAWFGVTPRVTPALRAALKEALRA